MENLKNTLVSEQQHLAPSMVAVCLEELGSMHAQLMESIEQNERIKREAGWWQAVAYVAITGWSLTMAGLWLW